MGSRLSSPCYLSSSWFARVHDFFVTTHTLLRVQSVYSIEVSRETITLEGLSMNFDDRIKGYRCDDQKNVMNNPGPITQGDFLIICIEVKPDDDLPLEISTRLP